MKRANCPVCGYDPRSNTLLLTVHLYTHGFMQGEVASSVAEDADRVSKLVAKGELEAYLLKSVVARGSA